MKRLRIAAALIALLSITAITTDVAAQQRNSGYARSEWNGNQNGSYRREDQRDGRSFDNRSDRRFDNNRYDHGRFERRHHARRMMVARNHQFHRGHHHAYGNRW